LLCAEILGIAIRSDKNIKGITIWNEEFKLSQYADDTDILLDGSENSLKRVLEVLDWFSVISGLLVNKDKTKLVWIGSMRESDRRFCRENNFQWITGNFSALGITYNTQLCNITEINILPKLPKLKNLLNMWKSRNLTPFGKITVIKSLILPTITHMLSSLPSPKADTIKLIENLFFNFIWNGKRDKIKRAVLIQPYEEGGLRMVNLANYIKGLKLTWLRRYIGNKQNWGLFADNYLPKNLFNTGGNHKENLQNSNPFWCDILEAWQQFYKNVNPISVDDILSEPIWYNDKINLQYIGHWLRKGIIFVGDICSNGKFLSIEEIKANFSVNITFLDHYRLIKAIPKEWRVEIEGNPSSPYLVKRPTALKYLLNDKKGCRNLCNILNHSQKTNVIKAEIKWASELSVENSRPLWRTVYKLPFTLTTNTNLRYFQFRLSHRILTTNTFLHLIKVQDDSNCSFCGEDIEDLLHLFCKCKHIVPIWIEVNTWLNRSGFINLDRFRDADIILGILDQNIIVNFVILITKFAIYNAKLKGKIPTFATVKAYIKYVMNIENNAAIANNSLDKFLGKWSAVYHSLR
jgi:hypothetical protein